MVWFGLSLVVFLTYRHFSNFQSDFDAVKSKVGLQSELSKTNLCLNNWVRFVLDNLLWLVSP